MPEYIYPVTTQLIFDGDCAFCTRCVLWGQKHLAKFPETLAYQAIKPEDYGLTTSQVANSIWLISAKLKPLPANEAIAAILRAETAIGWRLLGWAISLPLIRGGVKRGYYWVARNRAKMPGATAACELPDTLK